MTLNRTALIGLVLACSLSTVASGLAQDQSAETESYQAITTEDAGIPVDNLKVMLRPLDKTELEVEAQTWLELLRSKITEVGNLELKIKNLDESEPGEPLTAQLVELRQEEASLAP